MEAFITGGAGFIGSHLVEALLKSSDHRVTVYDNLSTGRKSYLKPFLSHPRFRFIQGDLLDARFLRRVMGSPDIVFHLAANSNIAKGAARPDSDFHQGIVATFHLLEAMGRAHVPKIAFTSGSGVYGDQGSYPTPEAFGPLFPVSMYGAGKLAAEAIISAFAHMHGMQAYIFRMANVVGARLTHGVIFDFIRGLKANPRRLEVLGDGRQRKPYIHISDVIEAIFLVLKKARRRVNLYNIGSDDQVTVRWIAERVVRQLGLHRVQLIFGKGPGGWKGDIPIYRFDLGKIHRLGWSARLNSKQAVQRAIAEMLGKGNSP